MTRFRTNPIPRFWKKVDKRGEDECWNWLASTMNGYGSFRLEDKKVYAHRFIYELTYGPPKKNVLHKCSNELCVNPKHLYDGSDSANSEDSVRAGTWGGQKLSAEQVVEIKKLLAQGVKSIEIARKFNVVESHISNIKAGRARQNV